MAHTFLSSHGSLSLSAWLAGRRDGSLHDRLVLARRLAAQVEALHCRGQIHRAIQIDSIIVDEQLQPQLPPAPDGRRFGGADSDPEFCPPELTGGAGLELPAAIEAATDVLRKAGYAIDPRRIDVYQLGTVLCQLITGQPVLSYIYDATVKAHVPALLRPLLERTLGLESPERFENCETLVQALDQALQEREFAEASSAARDTPAQGSHVFLRDDTPPQGTPQRSAAHESAELPFQRLGHYRIMEQIGSGGMGDVYRGYDESLDRPVAIKVLPPQLARNADFVRRFHAEATAAASIAHPNVVPIYSIGEDVGHHYFAMQYVAGESLAERLHRQGHFPVDQALELVGQCLAGLQAAHSRGLIHRDVKPGNILIEQQTGRAMLVDFGLVRRLDESARMTATGVLMGTVDYIAPEQARGRSVDARADIYSLGVLCYQVLSGHLPFIAESPTAMVFQHAYEPPFPLEEAMPGLPPPVVQIVGRMMAKDPDQRYPDCAAVLADIQAYRQGRPLAPAVSESKEAGPSEVLEEPKSTDEPELPEGLSRLLAPGRGQGVREWAATMFRRHAPQYLQEMQGTSQQMDAAVAHYERRRNRLARLCHESRAIEAELSEQIEAHVAAAAAAAACATAATEHEKDAALARQREHEETQTALRSQHALQRQQGEDLEAQLSQADATLARLHSQRDLLNARLKAAEARRAMELGAPPRSARRLQMMVGTAIATTVALVLGMSLLGRSFVSSSRERVAVIPDTTAIPKVDHEAKLNEAQRSYRDWTEQYFKGLLNPPGLQGLGPYEKVVKEDEMLKQLASNDGHARIEAINTLVHLGSKKAVPGLLTIAAERRQKDNLDRWMATRALGLIGDLSVVPDLVHLTYHYNKNTQLWAQISLVRLTGENFGNDVTAWKRWWEAQGGAPPIAEQTVAWMTTPEMPQRPAVDSPVVVEGVGWGNFRVGASREELIKAFGPPDPNLNPLNRRVSWIAAYHVDCMIDESRGAFEIRFNEGFKLPLTSGIRIGSSEAEVLSAYGAPDRVVNQSRAKMLEYDKRGVLMWVMNGEVTSFTVFRLTNTEFSANNGGASLGAKQQIKAQQRMARDQALFSQPELNEMESLTRIADQKVGTEEAWKAMTTLVQKYKKANRTGCSLVYLGQMSHGDDKIAYFQQAIAEHGDCFYGDGVQVGAYARFLLGQVYREKGDAGKAKKLFDEIRKDYPDSIDHRGMSLVAQLPTAEIMSQWPPPTSP
jgi:serine/threonine protein kinase